MNLTNKVAVYVRLSQEDGLDDTSQSIINQIELAKEYCNNNGLLIKEIYKDDGYTGSNFNRPAFNKMLDDIKAKKIDVVITKDLSRLGRNFLGAGYYIEQFFPLYNVRYISINDNFDSLTATNEDIVVLSNFINEMYVKECKKKTALSVQRRSKTTIMANGPYGYVKKDGLLYIDEEVAPIVREIFERFVNLESVKGIITNLSERKVLIPAAYRNQKYGYKLVCGDPYTWDYHMINDILKKVEYTGCSNNCKLRKKRRNKNSVILEDTHEAIISKELFDKTRTIMASRKKPKKVNDDIRLKGFYYLDDRPLIAMKATNDKIRYYYCKEYHINIRADYLHEATYHYCLEMYKKLRRKNSLFVSQMREEFNTLDYQNKKRELENEIRKIIRKYEMLVENMLSGTVTNEEFMLKKDVFDAKMRYLEEQINQLIFEIAKQEERERQFQQQLDDLEKISKKINKLDFIRALATRCDVTKTKTGYGLNIKFKFQL